MKLLKEAYPRPNNAERSGKPEVVNVYMKNTKTSESWHDD